MTRQQEFYLPEFSRGIHLITSFVEQAMDYPEVGVLHVFIKHTSAGLCLNENADPTVRGDMNEAFNRLVPENQSYFQHTMEGPDDMPAHIKSVIVGAHVSIPISHGKLNLGTWQGLYLCEFRNHGGPRKLVLTVTT